MGSRTVVQYRRSARTKAGIRWRRAWREADLAAMLADVPMGEGPIGGVCSVTTVVISNRGKGDRPVGKLGSKSPGWLGEAPVRSARGTSNSTGRSESDPVKPRKPSVHLKRMMGNLGSAEPPVGWRRPMSSAKKLSKCSRWTPRGPSGQHVEKEHTAKAWNHSRVA